MKNKTDTTTLTVLLIIGITGMYKIWTEPDWYAITILSLLIIWLLLGFAKRYLEHKAAEDSNK